MYRKHGESVFTDKNGLKTYIVDALSNDKPVILFQVGMRLYRMTPRTNTDNWFEITDDFFKTKNLHYVTITGLFIVKGELCLKVQSWGTIRYLKYNEIFGELNVIYCPI